MTRDDFKLNCSEELFVSPTAHPTLQCRIRYMVMAHGGVVRRFLTGFFQEGKTLSETFNTKVTKGVPLPGSRDIGDVIFHHILDSQEPC